MKIDLTKNVKLSNPSKGEENLVYSIVNYNEGTERAIIECLNSGMSINPTELVSINDIINL